MDIWQAVKGLYKEKFDIPAYVLDFVAVYDVLLKCVEGYSNVKISRYVSQDTKYISEILIRYFSFNGWDADLDFSPIALYNRCNGDILRYKIDVETVTNLYDKECINFTYFICRRFNRIKKEISEKYDSKS